MTEDPRLAIIGAGSLSSRRIYPYIGAAGAQLVGVCDLDETRAARNARLFGGRPYADIDGMLAAEKPDGVIVCIDAQHHAELATKLIRLGVPVYTEKPPAETAADALRVAREAQKHGVLCMTAFKKRYNTAYTRAREWLDTYPVEHRLALSIDYCSATYANDTLRRDFLFDFCIHAIDLAAFLFGDVATVYALSVNGHGYAVSLRFTCGAVGSLCFSDGRSFRVPTEEVEITLRDGNFMTIHNSSHWRITRDGEPCEWREPSTFTSQGDSGRDTGHLAELEAFVAALREYRNTTRSDIAESYKSMVLYEAIRTSAQSGQPVEPQYEC
jgi:myo-inositol 2-dehydrogenase/D-chiro-inositol 1-dehydrogenase